MDANAQSMQAKKAHVSKRTQLRMCKLISDNVLIKWFL